MPQSKSNTTWGYCLLVHEQPHQSFSYSMRLDLGENVSNIRISPFMSYQNDSYSCLVPHIVVGNRVALLLQNRQTQAH